MLPTAERVNYDDAEKIDHRQANRWSDTGMVLDEIKWRLDAGQPPQVILVSLDEIIAHCRFRAQYNRTMMTEGVEVAERFAELPIPLDAKADLEKLLKLTRKSADRMKKAGSNGPTHTVCFNCLRPGHLATQCLNVTAPGVSQYWNGKVRARYQTRSGQSTGTSDRSTPTSKSS